MFMLTLYNIIRWDDIHQAMKLIDQDDREKIAEINEGWIRWRNNERDCCVETEAVQLSDRWWLC